MHKLSAVFLDRGDRCDPVESGQKPLCQLMALPFTVYRAIRAHDMYRMAQEDAGHRPPGRDFFRRAVDAGTIRESRATRVCGARPLHKKFTTPGYRTGRGDSAEGI